jgi:outer membrane immunogenic protein
MIMKAFKLSALAIVAVAAATPTLAADMPVKARPVAVAPLYDWSGWYVGGNVGYSWGRSRTDVQYFTAAGAPIAPPPGSITSADTKLDGAIGGGQIGVNWQSGQWLFGAEADIQWSGQKGSSAFLCAGSATIVPGAAAIPGACLPGLTFLPPGVTGTSLALSQDLEWFGTARLRLGWLPAPTWLIYVTGGAAFGEIESTATLAGTGINLAPVLATATTSTTRLGWTVGGGIEGVISGPWTGKIEYLYMDLGTVTGAVALPPPGIQATYSSRITDNIVRVGLNYRFLPTGGSRM